MSENLQTNQESGENKAGCLGIGFSVLFPIIGFILYFVKKESVTNPGAYSKGALVGLFIGFFLRLLTGTRY